MKRRAAHLEMVEVVTREHADTFAEEWNQGNMFDAFGETGILTFPEDFALRQTPAQARYRDLEGEICDRTYESVKRAISDAFLTIANEVLARERKRH